MFSPQVQWFPERQSWFVDLGAVDLIGKVVFRMFRINSDAPDAAGREQQGAADRKVLIAAFTLGTLLLHGENEKVR